MKKTLLKSHDGRKKYNDKKGSGIVYWTFLLFTSPVFQVLPAARGPEEDLDPGGGDIVLGPEVGLPGTDLVDLVTTTARVVVARTSLGVATRERTPIRARRRRRSLETTSKINLQVSRFLFLLQLLKQHGVQTFSPLLHFL